MSRFRRQLCLVVLTLSPTVAANPDRLEERSAAARLELYRHLAKDREIGCRIFDLLGPAERCTRHAGNSARLDRCASSVGHVRCQRDRFGWYVPFASDTTGCVPDVPCQGTWPMELSRWRLWYVPFDELAPVRLLTAQTVFEEFDLQFTTFMRVVDLDGDGIENLVLGRGWSHPEGMGSGASVYLVGSNSRQIGLAVDRIEDVDHDGFWDILLDFDATLSGTRCELDPNDPWDPDSFARPSLLLHATAPGAYTTRDETARRFRDRVCPKSTLPVVSTRGGIVDEYQTADRILCQLAEGSRPDEMHIALDRGCSIPYVREKDCRARRPHVCKYGNVIHGWIDRFYRATVLAHGWAPLGTCERCCPLAASFSENSTQRADPSVAFPWREASVIY